MCISMGQYRHTYVLLYQLKGPKRNNAAGAASNAQCPDLVPNTFLQEEEPRLLGWMTDPRNWAGSNQDEPELFVVPLSKESLEQNKPKPNPTLMRVCQRA